MASSFTFSPRRVNYVTSLTSSDLGFPGGSVVKNSPAMQDMQETQVLSLGQEDPLEEGMATHSSILAWRIPWRRSLVGYSPCGRKESDTTERLHFHFHT